MSHCPTAAVRSATCLTLALCTMVSGCAMSRPPISLTQWSWGRSLKLMRDKDESPSFESDLNSPEDVTSVDAKDGAELPPEPKEPRKLFGFGGSRKSEDEIKSNRTHHDNRVVPQIERGDEASERHWYDRFTSSRTSQPKSIVNDEAEQSRQRKLYDEAERLFQEQRYAEASKLLKPLTKKKQSFLQIARFWNVEPEYREDHNRVREDSMFLLAESYFKEERFSEAKDYYEVLLKEYPSTRHLNTATKRLFVVGRTWLGFPEFATSDDVTPVNLEDPRATPIPKKQRPPHAWVLIPNFTDKHRPTFDTPGNALDALKSIWMYDPRGPLADDAIMMTASHYFRVGNFSEADRYFSMLREEYPNSPHLQTSFVLGSHVKLMSYQGASYDEKQLEDARQLKESTLRLFPNLPEKERLKDELAKIEEARAQRLWDLVELYGRKRKPKAQIIYAEELLQTYPKSSYAPQAREVLAKLRAPHVEKPTIGTRVLDSLPRLRKPPDEGVEFDPRGSARLNEDLPSVNDHKPGKNDPELLGMPR
ncbi:MAG: tetratricopeptide repeat protein [Planctomycetes bacterium]|nr:tetratricopeptide repeat protein [Planctomycetota bacterium]